MYLVFHMFMGMPLNKLINVMVLNGTSASFNLGHETLSNIRKRKAKSGGNKPKTANVERG